MHAVRIEKGAAAKAKLEAQIKTLQEEVATIDAGQSEATALRQSENKESRRTDREGLEKVSEKQILIMSHGSQQLYIAGSVMSQQQLRTERLGHDYRLVLALWPPQHSCNHSDMFEAPRARTFCETQAPRYVKASAEYKQSADAVAAAIQTLQESAAAHLGHAGLEAGGSQHKQESHGWLTRASDTF